MLREKASSLKLKKSFLLETTFYTVPVINARVYVTLKESVLDPQGQAVNTALHHMGYQDVQDVRIGKYIELKLQAASPEKARQEVDEMGRNLLSNPVIESFRFDLLNEEGQIL